MQPGGVLAGRFLVERAVRSGGMGTIFRGRDVKTGALVAIKALRPHRDDDLVRFERETSVLAQLTHPGVVRYVAHGVDGDIPYLVMEWVDGETVGDRLRGDGFTIREAAALARDTADALAAAHARGVLHRDVTPGNVMLTDTGVRVVDFGIVRAIGVATSLTKTGAFIGTPGYMAPEQASGDKDLDARVDVFALGCLLYECITGVAAFAGDNLTALHLKVLFAQPSPIAALAPETPADLAWLIGGMLAKDRDERPRDGAEVVAALDAIGELPDAPRRSRATADAPTNIVSRRGVATDALPASIVLVAADPDSADVPVGLDALVARFDGRLAVLDGGTLVVTIDAAGVHAAAAARCALALGARLPGRPIIVATAAGAGGLQAALDRGARLLEADEIAAVFRRDRVAIRVDDATRALLDDRFQLEPSPTGALLRGGP